uniref:Secreted protein n=1 Tax=Anopheles christyi TaxID=43041 RepID=A0A182KID9_9DIPT
HRSRAPTLFSLLLLHSVYFAYNNVTTYSSSCTTVVFSETYRPSKNLRISLLWTVVDCWMRAADVLLAEEVTDLHQRVVLTDHTVDREMSMYGTHLVLESLGDTLDHVLDVRADGTDGGQFLLGTEPLLHRYLLAVHLENVDGQMAEVLDELSARALHRYDTGTHLHRHILWDGHRLVRVDGSHCKLICNDPSTHTQQLN